MKLLISIATYKRKEKLARLLHSLFHSSYRNFDIVVVCDGCDILTANEIEQMNAYPFRSEKVKVLIQPEHRFVVGAWNRSVKEVFIPGDYDAFIGLCDDIQVYSDALKNIVQVYQLAFDNRDGVMGFNQVCEDNKNYTFKQYGQMIIGRKFIERYKEVNYTYYAPMYKHFYADEELYNFAISLEKFRFCQEAILNHDHPSFTGSVDETHNIIRSGINSPKAQDIKTFKDRQTRGLTWGKSWEI